MTDEDERVYEVTTLNGRLSASLAKLHASDRSNVLHTLLSDLEFYKAIETMSQELNLSKPGSAVDDEFLDTFIIDRVLATTDLGDTGDDDFTKNLKAWQWMNNKLNKLLDAHGVPRKYNKLIREYMVLGDVNELSYVDNITVSINENTGALLIELDPRLTQTDLKKQIPAIFRYWNTRRGKIANPRHYSAKIAAELSREKSAMTYGAIAKKRTQDEAQIKKQIERIRKKREHLLSDT